MRVTIRNFEPAWTANRGRIRLYRCDPLEFMRARGLRETPNVLIKLPHNQRDIFTKADEVKWAINLAIWNIKPDQFYLIGKPHPLTEALGVFTEGYKRYRVASLGGCFENGNLATASVLLSGREQAYPIHWTSFLEPFMGKEPNMMHRVVGGIRYIGIAQETDDLDEAVERIKRVL